MSHRRALALAILALLLALPAAAQAGTYHVYTCAAGGKVYPNGAWKTADVAGVVEDSSCAGSSIALTVPAGARMANNTSSALTFTSPAGTTIADFALTRQIGYTNPVAEKTHKYFLFYALGPTVFAGAGNYYDPTRNALNAQKQWYGYPDNNVAVAKSAVTRASFPALAGYKGDATTIALRVGCFNRPTDCSVAAGGGISHILHGSDITINDPTAPAVTVEASGMLAGGARSGSDPVTVTASDNSGIRKVELLDVSNPAAPIVVGTEDYAIDRTSANKVCDYSQPAPCPGLSRETVRATSLPAGQRSVLGPRDRHRRERLRARAVPGVRGHPVRPRRAQRLRRDRHRLAVGDLDQGPEGEPAHAELRRQGRRPRPADQQLRRSRSAARRCCCSAATCARAPR